MPKQGKYCNSSIICEQENFANISRREPDVICSSVCTRKLLTANQFVDENREIK
jgi:hypothetical protein